MIDISAYLNFYFYRPVEMEEKEENIKFLVKLPDEEQDEIMAYNDIIDTIVDQYDDELNNPERKWLFKCITAHKGFAKYQAP